MENILHRLRLSSENEIFWQPTQVRDIHCNAQQMYYPGKSNDATGEWQEYYVRWTRRRGRRGRINLRLSSDTDPVINRQMSPLLLSSSSPLYVNHDVFYQIIPHPAPIPGQCQCVCQNVEEQEKCVQVRRRRDLYAGLSYVAGWWCYGWRR